MSEYHIKNNEGVRHLSAAVFIRAYEDWSILCRLLGDGKIVEEDGVIVRGPKATRAYYVPRFSFTEIETFIRNNAWFWVEMDPDLIMEKLYQMRRKAITKARALR